jgi:4-hydroxythreonine-4-phosphate dehydrogenase
VRDDGGAPRPIAISLGDPAGIGPEVVARALAARPDLPVIVYGDAGLLARAARVAQVEPPPTSRIQAVTTLAASEVTPGRPNDVTARAQLAYLEAATDATLSGRAAALVTAPISKEWIARAGFAFPGHTEYLAARAGAAEVAMMLAGPDLRVTLATTHLALRDVPRVLSVDAITSAIVLTASALARGFAIATPRVAVAGLNPHAGEAGRFGDEETRLVVPAIAAARAKLAASAASTAAAAAAAATAAAASGAAAVVTGPHVPDVVFREAAGGAFDAVVALYHDQGLIPVKLLHFDDAVNVTLGLPFVRTSPDHGTAYDIAGRGVARAASFLAALDMASALSAPRS